MFAQIDGLVIDGQTVNAGDVFSTNRTEGDLLRAKGYAAYVEPPGQVDEGVALTSAAEYLAAIAEHTHQFGRLLGALGTTVTSEIQP